jgi:saccharopine dehydrogenase-like NADP-dependent oxidoreductase
MSPKLCGCHKLKWKQVTASLGSYVFAALLSNPDFNVTVVSHESSNSIFPSMQKAIKVPDSYSDDALVEAFRGQDIVIPNLAVGIEDPSKQLVDAAVKAGVKRITLSDYGSTSSNENTVAVFPLAAKVK